MRLWTRLAAVILVVVGAGFVLLLQSVLGHLKPIYRSATEEPLVDASRLLAQIVADASVGDVLATAPLDRALRAARGAPMEAKIYDWKKSAVDLVIYATDARGRVVFDSRGGRDVGKDYSTRNDVWLTMRGKYGARTSHDLPEDPSTSVMYVAAPVRRGDTLLGVLSLGKPTRTVNALVEGSRRRLVWAGLGISLAVIVLALTLAQIIVRPLRTLADHARAVRDGGRPVLPDLGTTEVRAVGEALEEMRSALEGKAYVERTLTALAHELKSPLAALRGTAELMGEPMPEDQRRRFATNLVVEVGRMTGLVDRLCLWATLEARTAAPVLAVVDLRDVVSRVVADLGPAATARAVTLVFDASGSGVALVKGERLLLENMLANLATNALEFAPQGSTIRVTLQPSRSGAVPGHEIRVSDEGPGVPAWALDRVFDRFFSLERPDTGRRSSGLGLALVREIAMLHRGDVTLTNRPGGGAEAIVTIPTA